MPVALCNIFAALVQLLAWLGRQGTRAVAALVFLGIAVPPLGERLRPFVTEAVFLLLCISFMRVDASALRAQLRRPAIVLAATAWTLVAVPAMTAIICLVAGLDRHSPDLFLGLMLQAVASPMMASPALAALMGLDSTLVLITLVTGTAMVPLTASLFAYVFFSSALTLSPLGLGAKLFLILAGSLGVAAIVRRMVGLVAITRHKAPIDGLNILILLVFVSAVMSSVAESFWHSPLKVAGLTLLAFAVFFALLGSTMLVFRRLGAERALALGLMVSQRNMGLMVAATDGVLPGLTWLYFALSQFPIYLSPQLLKPMAERLTGQGPEPAVIATKPPEAETASTGMDSSPLPLAGEVDA
jgi:BASS family bile acid:Na+ symporter